MNNNKLLLILLCLAFLFQEGISQNVVLNEVMSLNHKTRQDQDGDFPDWVELYNNSDQSVDLNGWALSDDENELIQWTFPEINLEPHQYLFIFASGKDRKEAGNIYYRTIIDEGDDWKYKEGDATIADNWNTLDFNDSQWQTGPSGFGYNDGDDNTYLETRSIYLRKEFNIEDINDVDWAWLDVDYDDAFVAYLNGQEIARGNIGSSGEKVNYDQYADEPHEASMYKGGQPDKFDTELIKDNLQSGENILAIQVHNSEPNSTDLTLIPFFTLSFMEPTSVGTKPPAILGFTEQTLHTNFRIDSDGDKLILSSDNGSIVDSLYTGPIPADISNGRKPDGADNWVLFADPTPGSENNTQEYSAKAKKPTIDYSAGFYENSFETTITSSQENVTIHFTRNGSIPGESDPVYKNPIQIDEITVLRARAFADNMLPSETATATYFINVNKSLPIVSLSTEPDNLYGNQGIFEEHFDREIAAHCEFFEKDQQLGFSHEVGAEVFGGGSAGFPQKSLAIFFRSEYGPGELDYHLIPDLPIDRFESFILRNSGNDWWSTMFRDPLVTNYLMQGTSIDYQEYQPVVTYINGEYWGIYNLREKISEHYVASHHDVATDNIDLLEYKELPNPLTIHGDQQHYNDLLNFLENNDMTQAENYEHIEKQIDIDNFLDYQIGEIYCANIDWPANNNKFWRPKTTDGKWRWIMYDTDTGFGLWDEEDEKGWQRDHIEHATNSESVEAWPNPAWSTFIFRKLLENDTFRNEFINRFAGYLETRFKPDFVLEKIDEIIYKIESEIPARSERWQWEIEDWDTEVEDVKKFARHRPFFVRKHIMEHFDIDDSVRVNLEIQPEMGGRIGINSVIMPDYPFAGIYFKDIPLDVVAYPNESFEFVKWEMDNSSNSDSISITPNNDLNLRAVFERVPEKSIVINEINYNSEENFNTGDWIELYNFGDNELDISGWQLKDGNYNNTFIIPQNTVVDAGQYLVICESESLLTARYDISSELLRDFDFKFDNGGEVVRLYNNQDSFMDIVEYDDEYPWPLKPDGQGYTLELINPYHDNNKANNWSVSELHGSPGKQNHTYSTDSIKEKQIETPSSFYLKQNYPNPFNASTRIEYRVAVEDHIKIVIFDLLGRKVQTLVNKIHSPGAYSVTWNGTDRNHRSLPSGIYFYRIKTDNFADLKKMVLIK